MRYLVFLNAIVFLVSFVVHAATFMGFSPAQLRRGMPLAEIHPIWMIHAFVVLLTALAFLAVFRGKLGSDFGRTLAVAVPRSVWRLWFALAAYAAITLLAHTLVITGGTTDEWRIPPDHIAARIFSAWWMLFSSLAGLICYAGQTTRKISRDA